MREPERQRRGWWWVALLVLGCGPGGPKTYAVQGHVTWENKPLPDGYITFAPAEGEAETPVAAPIKDGHFQLRVTAGPKRVEVQATREVGEVDPSMGARARRPYIPARYNTESELQADIQPNDENQFEFSLR